MVMFDHLRDENEEVRKELTTEGIGHDEIEFIKRLIFPEGGHSCPVRESDHNAMVLMTKME